MFVHEMMLEFTIPQLRFKISSALFFGQIHYFNLRVWLKLNHI